MSTNIYGVDKEGGPYNVHNVHNMHNMYNNQNAQKYPLYESDNEWESE